MGPESVELYRTVTGVDSESHRLRIRLNGPCTEQAVDYSPDPEGRTLCQAFNERQKLRCSAVFSPSGAIERILRIDAASALELCAITVAPFQVDVGTIHLKEPLRLREQLGTAAESPVHVEYPDPNLLVFAEFQDNMEELVLNKLANKRQWIIESDDELTEYALEVKRQFLSIVEEGQLWSAIQQTRPSQIPAANVSKREKPANTISWTIRLLTVKSIEYHPHQPCVQIQRTDRQAHILEGLTGL